MDQYNRNVTECTLAATRRQGFTDREVADLRVKLWDKPWWEAHKIIDDEVDRQGYDDD